MNLRSFLVAAVLGLAAVEAIGHDQVQPFPQPDPVTAAEKAAITFKPSLWIYSGCHAYPAVNGAGETSGGLKPTGSPDGHCKGSGLGSQVYGRASLYNNMWAIMYAWYFPKNQAEIGDGHRHDWEHVVVWIDNPEAAQPMMSAISVWQRSDYKIVKTELETWKTGNSPNVYLWTDSSFQDQTLELSSTSKDGQFQDLIMWEQLTDAARTALEDTDFGADAVVPFKDATFQENLVKAWPVDE